MYEFISNTKPANFTHCCININIITSKTILRTIGSNKSLYGVVFHVVSVRTCVSHLKFPTC